jgi:hypothetical protein
MLALVGSSYAEDKITEKVVYVGGSYTGEALLSWTEEKQVYYIAGVLDGYCASTLFGGDENEVKEICSIKIGSKSRRQIWAITVKYIKNNPTQWHLPCLALIYNALHEANEK